jgi:hypothetical protein
MFSAQSASLLSIKIVPFVSPRPAVDTARKRSVYQPQGCSGISPIMRNLTAILRLGTSDNNRRATFCSIIRGGQKQLAMDTAYWQRLTGVMGHVLGMPSEGHEQ